MGAKKANLKQKPLFEVKIYLDITDSENPKVVSEESFNKLIEETRFCLVSKWRKPTLNLGHIIEMNQYVEKIVNGQIQRLFDESARMNARIRVLLREWNLQELDEELKLVMGKCVDNPNMNVLSDDTMKKLGDIEPAAIMYSLYNKVLAVLYPELYSDEALLKNLKSGEEKTQ